MSAPAAAVLWDMDGVLVDSEPLWTVAETELFASYDRVWDADVKAAVIGKRLDASVPLMLELGGIDADVATVSGWLLRRMVQLFGAGMPWRPGARELVQGIADRGVPQALVSSSYRVLVDAVLDEIGGHHFATTVAGDEVPRAKPDPEPYTVAAGRLGAAPQRCVVIEDSLTGVAAAEAAGCICLAVPELVHIPPEPWRPVVRDLREVDADWLLALPATARRPTPR